MVKKGSKTHFPQNDPTSFGMPKPVLLSYFQLFFNQFCLHKCQNWLTSLWLLLGASVSRALESSRAHIRGHP